MKTKKQPKSYVVTEKQALRIFEGCCNCATDACPESTEMWKAVKAAFPGLWKVYHYCPAIGRIESTGWNNRIDRAGSCHSEVPVKWAFSRKG